MEKSSIMAGLLHEIGLSGTEAEVYLELLKEDDVFASVVSDRVKNSRTHVYDTLDSLADMGLITYVIKSGKRYYKASHPRKLVDFLSEKKTRIEEQKEQMIGLIPQFLELYGDRRRKSHIEVFAGEEGLNTVLKDILRHGLNYSILNASKESSEESKKVLKSFYYSRKKLKLGAKLLYKKGSKTVENQLDKVKFVSAENFGPVPTYIYGDNVAMVLKLEEITILKIENRELAHDFSKQFERLWKAAER